MTETPPTQAKRRRRRRRPLDESLPPLVAGGRWPSVCALGERYERSERSRYLWAWPTRRGIRTLGLTLRRLDCEHVLSIGCGAGLLEWLLQQSCGEYITN